MPSSSSSLTSSSSVRGIKFGHVMSGMCSKMNRMKKLNDNEVMDTPLKRCLTTFDITLLGVGHMVGAGIYVLTGTVARNIAGPGVILSFLIAGIASLLAAFCYAEFGARVPKAGSAYVYTYVAVGEFWAFIIGWNIILEHMIGAASVARAWSGYVDSLSGGAFTNFTRGAIIAIGGGGGGDYDGGTSDDNHRIDYDERLTSSTMYLPDPLAAGLCILYAFVLGCGVKGSAALNSILTVVNLAVMALVIGLGLKYADLNNWSNENGGFLPFNVNGVLAGAATCFYAYVGFDSIATSGEEAKDPGKSIPLATALSMAIVTIGYVMVGGVLTLVVPYWMINPTAALPEAFASKGVFWAKYVISIGALCGMTTTLFGSLFSLPRIMYAMASDGLLFDFLGRVNERTKVPIVNLAISGALSALIALVFDLQHLVEFMSIGTFLAYTIVSTSVIILRYRPEPGINARSAVMAETPNSGGGKHIGIDNKSPTTEGADSSANSDCNSIHSVGDSEQLLEYYEGTGRLKRRCLWLSHVIGTWEPGCAVVAAVIVFTASCACLSILNYSGPPEWWNSALRIYFLVVLAASLLTIEAHQQSPPTGKFRVPLVPMIPALSVYINISLMSHLSSMTWLRFLVWMIVGMFIYFLYGIHHSKEAATGKNSYSVLMTSVEAERATRIAKTAEHQQKSDKDPIISSSSERQMFH